MWFQLDKCKNLLLFFVINYNKINIFGSSLMVGRKKATVMKCNKNYGS